MDSDPHLSGTLSEIIKGLWRYGQLIVFSNTGKFLLSSDQPGKLLKFYEEPAAGAVGLRTTWQLCKDRTQNLLLTSPCRELLKMEKVLKLKLC